MFTMNLDVLTAVEVIFEITMLNLWRRFSEQKMLLIPSQKAVKNFKANLSFEWKFFCS